MPQDDVASKLAAAKSTLSHASAAFPSSMAPKTAAPAASTPAPAKPASTGTGQGSGIKEGVESRQQSLKALLPKMHNGGPVLHDGGYSLKAGEHVLTAAEAQKAKKHALMAVGMKSLAKAGKRAKEVKETGGLTTTKKVDTV